jgi:hypothetical protein
MGVASETVKVFRLGLAVAVLSVAATWFAATRTVDVRGPAKAYELASRAPKHSSALFSTSLNHQVVYSSDDLIQSLHYKSGDKSLVFLSQERPPPMRSSRP